MQVWLIFSSKTVTGTSSSEWSFLYLPAPPSHLSIPPRVSVDLNVLLGLILCCIQWISHLVFTGSTTGAPYTAQILHNSSGIHGWNEAEVGSFSDGLTLFPTLSQLVQHVDSFENIWVGSVPNVTHSRCILLKTTQFLPMNHYDPPTVLLLSENAPRPTPALLGLGRPSCPLVPCCRRQIVPGRVSQRRSKVKSHSLCGSGQPSSLNPSKNL